MVGLPGKAFYANPTATGHVPVYKANGMFAYVVTLITLCALVHTEMYAGAPRRTLPFVRGIVSRLFYPTLRSV